MICELCVAAEIDIIADANVIMSTKVRSEQFSRALALIVKWFALVFKAYLLVAVCCSTLSASKRPLGPSCTFEASSAGFKASVLLSSISDALPHACTLVHTECTMLWNIKTNVKTRALPTPTPRDRIYSGRSLIEYKTS